MLSLHFHLQSDKVWSVREALEGLVSKESVSGFTCSTTKAEVRFMFYHASQNCLNLIG